MKNQTMMHDASVSGDDFNGLDIFIRREAGGQCDADIVVSFGSGLAHIEGHLYGEVRGGGYQLLGNALSVTVVRALLATMISIPV